MQERPCSGLALGHHGHRHAHNMPTRCQIYGRWSSCPFPLPACTLQTALSGVNGWRSVLSSICRAFRGPPWPSSLVLYTPSLPDLSHLFFDACRLFIQPLFRDGTSCGRRRRRPPDPDQRGRKSFCVAAATSRRVTQDGPSWGTGRIGMLRGALVVDRQEVGMVPPGGGYLVADGCARASWPTGTGNDIARPLQSASRTRGLARLINQALSGKAPSLRRWTRSRLPPRRHSARPQRRWSLAVVCAGWTRVNARANTLSWPYAKKDVTCAPLRRARGAGAARYRVTTDEAGRGRRSTH